MTLPFVNRNLVTLVKPSPFAIVVTPIRSNQDVIIMITNTEIPDIDKVDKLPMLHTQTVFAYHLAVHDSTAHSESAVVVYGYISLC